MSERFKQVVCADIVFIKKENRINKVLLMERKNTDNDDSYFELPRGHLEANEDIFDAMIRETKEELKVKIGRKDIKLIRTRKKIELVTKKMLLLQNLKKI